MSIISYALVTYGITAVISLMTIVIVLGVNKIMNKVDKQNGQS